MRNAAGGWLPNADGVNVERARQQRSYGLPRVNGLRGKRPMTSRRRLPSELIIGVVGPYDLVERIMLSGAAARDEAFGAIPPPPGQAAAAPPGPPAPASPSPAARPLETADAGAEPGTPRDDPHGLLGGTLPRRLIAAAYRREREAAEKVARLGAAIDVCLFASPVPYEYARRAGVISVPSTYVRLDGGALYAALLRASRSRATTSSGSVWTCCPAVRWRRHTPKSGFHPKASGCAKTRAAPPRWPPSTSGSGVWARRRSL